MAFVIDQIDSLANVAADARVRVGGAGTVASAATYFLAETVPGGCASGSLPSKARPSSGAG